MKWLIQKILIILQNICGNVLIYIYMKINEEMNKTCIHISLGNVDGRMFS